MSSPYRAVSASLAGIVFGAGLGIARMTDPRKVLNFLDLAGAWDGSLPFVLGGAVVVAFAGYRVVLKRSRPLFEDRFHLPATASIDAALIGGAVLFGIGWGLAGYCPGPAIASLGLRNPETAWFLPALVVGALANRWRERRRPPGTAEAGTEGVA